MSQSGKLKNEMLKQVQHDVLQKMTVIPNLFRDLFEKEL